MMFVMLKVRFLGMVAEEWWYLMYVQYSISPLGPDSKREGILPKSVLLGPAASTGLK